MDPKIAHLGPADSMDSLSLVLEGGDSMRDLAPEDIEIKFVDNKLSIEQQAKELEGIEAVIVIPSVYSTELARLTPSVKLVQTTSAGTNTIDKIALGELGIRVSNNG